MHCHKQNSIRFVVSLAGLALAFGSPLALAQDKPDAKKSSGAPAMKPPAELAQMKTMVGTWKCSSKMHLPPEMGGEQTGSTTMVIKKDLGGYWLVGQWKTGKTKAMLEMKGTIYWSYDPADKKFVELGVDSAGSYMHGTSDGPQGGTWVWNEDGLMMGKKTKSRTTVTQKTPDTTQVKFESEMEPGKWVPMGEDDCKKQPGGRA
jgi:uncharacterized protein DUF1579